MASARCAISIASSRVTWLWLSSPSLSRMIARRTGVDLGALINLSRQAKYSASYSDKLDRKSTRLNSSHRCISYAVFCLKKNKSLPHLPLGTRLRIAHEEAHTWLYC